DLELAEADLGERCARGRQLAEAAVDHEQVRQAPSLAAVSEPPAEDLRDRREVVGALDAPDAVVAVPVLVRLALVEGDHRAHRLAPLEGGDVETLDALRRVGEPGTLVQLGDQALAPLRR